MNTMPSTEEKSKSAKVTLTIEGDDLDLLDAISRICGGIRRASLVRSFIHSALGEYVRLGCVPIRGWTAKDFPIELMDARKSATIEQSVFGDLPICISHAAALPPKEPAGNIIPFPARA